MPGNRRVDRYFSFFRKYIYEIALGVILLTAFYLRFKYVFTDRLWPDEALYAWLGQRIFQIPSIIFSAEAIEYHPPLFSVFLALGHIFFSPLFACQLISLAFGMLGIIAVYALGLKVGNKFIGLFSATLLAFNPVYLRYSTKILADSPQLLFCALLALALLRVSQNPDNKSGLMVGLLGAGVILIKWNGVVVVPWIVLFYLFVFQNSSLREKFQKLLVSMLTISAVLVFLIINNINELGRPLPFQMGVLLTTSPESPFFYYLIYLPSIMGLDVIGSPILLIFLVAGIYAVFKYELNKKVLLLTWFLVFLVVFSLSSIKYLRYGLVFLPSVFILTAIGIDDLIKRLLRTDIAQTSVKAGIFGLLGLSVFFAYPGVERALAHDNREYQGFKTAGEVIAQLSANDTLILATSMRQLRYHTGINYRRFGGQIIDYPRQKEAFEQLVRNTQEPILLELDNWGNPSTLPVHPKTIPYLEDLGFRTVREVGQMKYISDNGTKFWGPAIWIFEKKAHF